MAHITEGRMWSDRTSATATFEPDAAADGSGAWVVSWLPGRLLTHSQAVTAMMLAEVVAEGVPEGSPVWAHVDGWCAELHVSRAVALEALGLLGARGCPRGRPRAGDFRVLVTGSRDWRNPLMVYSALEDARAVAHEQGYTRFIVVHGQCPTGADKHASRWTAFPDAFADMPVIEEPHPADWDAFGKAAGFRRNADMVSLSAHQCLSFVMPCSDSRCRRPEPHGSHGASHCADLAEKAAIPVRRFTNAQSVKADS